MSLNRNVDNYFSETEQITFHLGHIVRGITFTDDALLQGRLFSYTDTQINRMNSVNYMQLPINRPLSPIHNHQRDGYAQHNVYQGNVAYYPNTLQNNTPEVASGKEGGYLEYPEEIEGKKQRGKSGKFTDHFSQAQLFYNSLTTHEQQQVVDGARFEIGRCVNEQVRKNMIEVLNQVDHNLAVRVATSLGAKVPKDVYPNANKTTVGLSIDNYELPKNIRAKKVAILTAPGSDVRQIKYMFEFLAKQGAYVDIVGFKMGRYEDMKITQTYVTTSSVLYDAVYVPSGTQEGFHDLMKNSSLFPYEEPTMFVLDMYRHGKPIAASGRGISLLKSVRLPLNQKLGVLINDNLSSLVQDFEQAIRKQRFWVRLTLDPNHTPSLTK